VSDEAANPCVADRDRQARANRDCGITEQLGNGGWRRIEFEVGYDHRAFPEACGGGGHGQHGMSMTFLLGGPDGVVQWKINMLGWVPGNVSEYSGGIRNWHPRLDLVMPTDLGHHWRTPTYEEEWQPDSDCEYIGGQRCFYDGSGLNAGELTAGFLADGPHYVWAHLARYYASTKASADEYRAGQPLEPADPIAALPTGEP
jgi:hypothetical protein